MPPFVAVWALVWAIVVLPPRPARSARTVEWVRYVAVVAFIVYCAVVLLVDFGALHLER